MNNDSVTWLLLAIPAFCFGYPFVMAWYWMVGGAVFHWVRDRHLPPVDQPPVLEHWPPITILVPCYNEEDNAEETLGAALAVDYPDFEVIAINDGSRDNTAAVLNAIAARNPRLRVVHLVKNQGKATGMIVGAALAKSEILVGIDGDALLDPHALRWIARIFVRSDLGAITGNPRIRNRTSILGKLQVGEFSAIVGLIKRAQASYGRLFTISGVICAFRKQALADAGWWSPRTLTEDVDISWRIQLAGWRIGYEPNAVCWILMPETLKGLWRQRLRWAMGGSQMMLDFFWPLMRGRSLGLLPVYCEYLTSVVWSYLIMASLVLGLLHSIGVPILPQLPTFSLIPAWWGVILTVTYLQQALISHWLERRFERQMMVGFFWVIWYPMAFWLISAATTVAALPLTLIRPRKERTTWVSPDRGLR
ncbi:poly-beta-1,6-N-acetyl-D-glucosamine synthase [Dongia sp.]|uniref:poly-beta-1,6-N-acetyl-D-glucosamine synthase n=1 Tax=Dongia sp. TaxID=1977262 RepID=UPI003751640C